MTVKLSVLRLFDASLSPKQAEHTRDERGAGLSRRRSGSPHNRSSVKPSERTQAVRCKLQRKDRAGPLSPIIC
ncbi:hypothetical protein ABVT39_011852 [Epinephelus coioides]